MSASSASNAWIAGYNLVNGQPVPYTEHWNGTSWTAVPSVNANGITALRGVSSTSASDAWVVGDTEPSPTTFATLTEHWNGTAWAVRPSPGAEGDFGGVDALKTNNAWAVGVLDLNAGFDGATTLIEHWNGSAWAVTPSP